MDIRRGLPAAVLTAGRVHADPWTPSSWWEQRYLQLVSQAGITGTPPDLLKVGYTICRNRDNGSSIRDEAERIQRSGTQMTWGQATHLVAAAGTFLCPGPHPVD